MSRAFELQAVSAGYPGRDVLKAIDLAVAEGERIAIVGPDGAGKSTLLRALTGLIHQSAGSVVLGDLPVAECRAKPSPDALPWCPKLRRCHLRRRVDDVVSLGRLPLRRPTKRTPRARPGGRGSGHRHGRSGQTGRPRRTNPFLGERQLVLLALAIAQKAPVIVLDEPTVHLDIRHQVDVMELLKDLNCRDGTTIVAVMHDLRLAAHYFPRIAVLADGRLVKDGPPDEALAPDVIRDVFGVDPGLLAMPWQQPAAS